MPDSSQEPQQSEPETIDHVQPAGISGEAQDPAEAVTQAPSEGPTGEWVIPVRVQIPGYEVLGLLGKGGMGVVYKARQVALDRTVALKMILHAEHAGLAERQRFQVEAEAAARLQHPNIIQVFHVGTHEGLPYLILEYCPGGSLAQQLKGNPWPIRKAAQLVEILAGAVEAAHAAKIVHRDLNPANVLLTVAGQPKITDFGLAKKLGEAARTQTGAVVGTPSYMSPEQASGKAKEVGPAADIYALGAILYELLAGRPPFKAATALDTILQVVADEAPPLRRLRPKVPRDLETICHKCLEKAPAARYASAESLAEDLRHFLDGEPIRIRRISIWERGVKWLRRRPAMLVAALASFGALLSLILLIAVSWRNVSTAPFVASPKGQNNTGANGRLSSTAYERVKRATVYLHARMADGSWTTGAGFFGCKDAPNIVLTHVSVLGMISPVSVRPQFIEIIVNRGEFSEWRTSARLLCIDRTTDLAVLGIGAPAKSIPEPLTVTSAAQLQHLDEVYVFGFPSSELLGNRINFRPSMSLLQLKSGQVHRVQITSDLSYTGSGGPVVDHDGNVIAVAVAGIPGQQLNLAIPGERVNEILNGRISELTFQQPFFADDNKLVLPVVMNTIDPRNLITEVGLKVWTGDKPAELREGNRPAAATQPSPQPGDSRHIYHKLKYMRPGARAKIVLEELPQGKVYWQQAKWITANGETHCADAGPLRLPSPPVSRKPANLVLRHTQGAEHSLDLTIDSAFKFSDADETNVLRIRTAATFTETVSNTGTGGTLLTLRYKSPPICERIEWDSKSNSKPKLEPIRKDLPGAITFLIQLDHLGNIVLQTIDEHALRQSIQTNSQQLEAMNDLHEMIQLALELASVSLPANGSVKPLETWRAERRVPIDTLTKTVEGKLDGAFTYQGTRKCDGREEAVISMSGMVSSTDNSVVGKADGQILVDLANGQILLAEMTAKLLLKAPPQKPGEKPQRTRRLDTLTIRMQRK